MVSLAEVEQLVKRMLGSTTAPVAVQKDGLSVSDGYRALNFTGPGVLLSNDGPGRRTIIYIPGTVGSTATTIISDTSAKALELWNGSSNNTPPANWQTTAFADGGWGNAVVSVDEPTIIYIAGTHMIWPVFSETSPSTEGLIRKHFTLGAGPIISATLEVAIDSILLGIYLNGTALATPPISFDNYGNPHLFVTLTPGQLVTGGGDNVLAMWARNNAHVPTSAGNFDFKLVINQAAASGTAGYVCIQDQKAQSTNGGDFTLGAQRTRDLNTIVADTASIASLASNRITLPAGTYQCRIRAPGFNVGRHQARLQDITAGTTLLVGTGEYASGAGAAQTSSWIVGRFTLAASHALEVQHRSQGTEATDGFGVASNFATEVYTTVEIWKE